MNKGELVDAVASRTGESRAAAGRMVDSVLGTIAEALREHERVVIAGFGTFRKRTRKARIIINPATKQPMQLAATTTVSFTPSAGLRGSQSADHNGLMPPA